MGHVCADRLAPGTARVNLRGHRPDSDAKRRQNDLIIIVDDDEYARAGLKALIESLGHRAVTFASAEEYLDSNIRESTSCLILDVHLLGMSGPDLQTHLIIQGCCPPTIFVTGRFEEHVRQRVIEAGALGYFIKLSNEYALLNCIGTVLRLAA
jgi:FixJ family two-component response regulator